jgi:hypothetical protein
VGAFVNILLAWVLGHGHHAHITPDGRICIGIPTVDRERVESTSIEYVRTYKEARDALGY